MRDYHYIDWSKEPGVKIEWPAPPKGRRLPNQIDRLIRENRNLKIALVLAFLAIFVSNLHILKLIYGW